MRGRPICRALPGHHVMPVITETARAKINLTLEVLGRRPDGYHELRSLVAFADLSDDVTLDLDRPTGAYVDGPYGPSITTHNLVDVTLRLLAEADPRLRLGHVHLTKRLPVAAGIGGGSADAAAVLRAVRRANPDLVGLVDWPGLAARLGADVPVCLESRAAWIAGKGDIVEPLAEPLPPLDAVLVNPMLPVPADKTAQVFRRLDAALVSEAGSSAGGRECPVRTRADIIRLMRERGNGLAAAAAAVVPEVAEVMAALAAVPGVEVSCLSGAGPTSFAILESRNGAVEARDTLRAAHRAWWIEAATLS